MPLCSTQYWYRGEHEQTQKLIGVSYSTFFVYKFGEATSVYYEEKNLKKASAAMIGYFRKNPGSFKNRIREYKTLYEQAVTFSSDTTAKAENLFATAVSMWPILTAIIVLGDIKSDDKVSLELRDTAMRARTETDVAIYDVGNLLEACIRKILPPHLKHYDNLVSIEEIVKGPLPTVKKLHGRQNGYIYHNDRLLLKSFRGFIKENGIEVDEEKPVRQPSIIRGSAACRGKISGLVRVVLEISDMAMFKEGEVLVSSMTVPDFLPIMKKAAAFVTDEGGITCHAAIVAREMNKPCIIGTKFATQMLKDGDRVEVDANEGTIRIIK